MEDTRITITPDGVGLGYEILTPVSALSIARIGESLTLYLHHHITDVSQTLFGFPTLEERVIFRKLLKVDGVGGKTALALLNLGMRQLLMAIESSDEKVLSSANGVGKKTALKIIVELGRELTAELLMTPESQAPLAPAHHSEITDTLVGMGYDKRAVTKVLESLPTDLLTVESKVVYAIKSLATR
jgi:Holliday junction DNA helicase RuvA